MTEESRSITDSGTGEQETHPGNAKGTKHYQIKAFLLALIVSPPLFIFIAPLFRRWARFVRENDLPGSFIGRYFPIVAAFGCYMLIWIASFDTRGNAHLQALPPTLLPLLIPQLVPVYPLLLMDKIIWFPWLQVAIYGSIALTVLQASREWQKPLTSKRGMLATTIFVIGLIVIAVHQNLDREANILPYDNDVETAARQEKRLYSLYRPFTKGNLLRPLDETSTLTLAADYPKLDGATSAFPIYGAAAEMVYRGLDGESAQSWVFCTQTAGAYERLASGYADVFFGLQPSPEQRAEIAKKGRELHLTPIAKDAFVFFVNRNNPVDSLTVEQIRDIYLKKITSWKAVGGTSEKIMAFQRPEHSGSQTIMLAEVMQGRSLPSPPAEIRAATMGTVIRRVADYRNSASAIGYSFFHYATIMNPDENIKLLMIDGVEPTPENIRTGAYPFVVNIYAATAGTQNENAKKLIDWLLSEQGQRLIENTGYIRLQEMNRGER